VIGEGGSSLLGFFSFSRFILCLARMPERYPLLRMSGDMACDEIVERGLLLVIGICNKLDIRKVITGPGRRSSARFTLRGGNAFLAPREGDSNTTRSHNAWPALSTPHCAH
jgi:hypothetical protein